MRMKIVRGYRKKSSRHGFSAIAVRPQVASSNGGGVARAAGRRGYKVVVVAAWGPPE
jgi:hypothetical protein